MRIVGASLGNCVHVAGIINFLRLAEELGHQAIFLGAAVPAKELVQGGKELHADLIGVSYRLTPEVAGHLLADLKHQIKVQGLEGVRMAFGGTPPVCEVARKSGMFEAVFSGLEPTEEVVAFLRGERQAQHEQSYGTTQLERLEKKRPFPLLRHHFGLPSMEQTLEGIRQIAEARTLDVISIAPDQNAQEYFFRPEAMDPALDGAGGCPIRTRADLEAIYEAAQRGNFPLLRIYSGTRDLVKWAETTVETIHNAWGTIPLCWYNALDRRSTRPPAEAIAENQAAIRWYAGRDIPVEINEAHHWSLRDAHDALAVAMAYLAAYNAKKLGVKYYIAQYMMNTPPSTYPSMDLAKMLAKMRLIEGLHDDNFTSLRQVRAGLLSLSPDPELAQGQLAASTTIAVSLRPHIIHVVGFCEGDHAATAEEVVHSCKIVRGVVKNCLFGMPSPDGDPAVRSRAEHLVEEARVIIEALKALGDGSDPLTNPRTLATAIKVGVLDAPQLKGNPHAAGRLQTKVVGGAVEAVDPATGRIIAERERLSALPAPSSTRPLLEGGQSEAD